MADPRVIKVAVGIPLKGHTCPRAYNDRMLMAFCMGEKEAEQRINKEPVLYEFNWFFTGEIFVPFARENLADLALRYGCDYLFMVDDDMLAPFDLFYQLVRHDKDIVAALAFTRNPPHNPVIYTTRQGWDAVARSRYYAKEYVINYPRNALVECDAVGFGAVLIKTELFKKMSKPWFMSSDACGEDVLFCTKAKEAGFRVYMDTTQKLGHISDSIIVTEEYSDNFNKLSESDREDKYGKYTRFESLEKVR